MEEKKNNSGLICLVIFLSVLVLGLAGYICYDKFYSKKEPVKTDEKEKDEKKDDVITAEDLVSKDTILKLAEDKNKYINTDFDKPINVTSDYNSFGLLESNFMIENGKLVLQHAGKTSVVSNLNEKIVQIISSPFNCDDVVFEYALTSAGNLYEIGLFDKTTRNLLPNLLDKIKKGEAIEIAVKKINTDDIKVLAFTKTEIQADSEGRNYTCGSADGIVYTSTGEFRSMADFTKVYEKLLVSAFVDADTGVATYTYADGTTETRDR